MGARLETTFIGNTSHDGNDRMGANAVAPMLVHGSSQLRENFKPQDAEKSTRENAVNFPVDFSVDFFLGPN